MNKKKISILALTESIATAMKREIQGIFEDNFAIETYYPIDIPLNPITDTDLILCHDPAAMLHFMPYINTNAQTLMTKRTISQDGVNKLKNLPAGKKVLVMNVTDYSTLETLSAIYQFGINQLQLYPFYKDEKIVPEVDYIVSPISFPQSKNIDAEEIIIGHRPMDISTILDIIAILEIDNATSEKILKSFQSTMPTLLHGVANTLKDKRTLMMYWQILLQEFPDGVLICDDNEDVIFFNPQMTNFLNINSNNIHGENLHKLILVYPELKILLSKSNVSNQLITFKSKKLIINIIAVNSGQNQRGKIIFCNEYDNLLKTQSSLQKQMLIEGASSKYSFHHIIGSNAKLMKAINISKKISNSNSAILLTGESGTGKEMFAGAIHNHSERKTEAFVALNCATLPETLLESELFGYEEGAFTGAKKGGKIGLFEKAHNGTLFLDEIGEIPLKLQARLLRALQEKEIIRLGGEYVISVNTRIIAATNKDLLAMVKEGAFRNDLYYRLNTFQVPLPPLRERTDDIQSIIENYYTGKNERAVLNKSFFEFAQNYQWPGNVRELINILEYSSAISENVLSYDTLPPYVINEINNSTSDITLVTHQTHEECIIDIIKKRTNLGLSAGRRSLHDDLKSSGINISEVRLRDILKDMVDDGLIVIHKGRKGCTLTKKTLT